MARSPSESRTPSSPISFPDSPVPFPEPRPSSSYDRPDGAAPSGTGSMGPLWATAFVLGAGAVLASLAAAVLGGS
ncbi:MAG: hypothetical protein ACRDNF_03620, partial [Streptosporangiaceae bacterium]